MKRRTKLIPGIEFLLIALTLIFMIFGVLGFISYQNTSKVLKKSIIQSTLQRTKDNSNLINQHLEEFKKVIEGISFKSEIQSMNWSSQKPVLLEEAKRLGVLRFQITDLSGYAFSTSGDKLDLSDREWIQKALKGETYISEPFQGRIDRSVIIVCATPIKDQKGNIIGSLTASIDPLYLYNIISNLKIGDTGFSFIITKEGKIIANTSQGVKPSTQASIEKNSQYTELYKDINDSTFGYDFYEYSNENYFVTYSQINNRGWFLALTAPEHDVFHELDTLKRYFTVLTFITITFCVFCCLLLVAYFSKTKLVENLELVVEEDKRLLKESAEIERIRTQFFANMTHEFKTPLNVILASIQLCKLYFDKEKSLNNTKFSKHLKTMKQNCYRLMRLVNNLLDTTKIDVGFLEKHAVNQNIVKIVEDITMSIKEFTEKKGINLHFDKNTNERIIACDVDKIERIMLNLISNAIKFTDEGGNIFVKVEDKGNAVLISVRDTGIGIPKEKQNAIFERFVQVEQTLTKNKDGSGIGLSMVKSFVELHGGRIFAISEFGKGSEFVVELPAIILENSDECYIEDMENQRRIERINIEFSDIYYS